MKISKTHSHQDQLWSNWQWGSGAKCHKALSIICWWASSKLACDYHIHPILFDLKSVSFSPFLSFVLRDETCPRLDFLTYSLRPGLKFFWTFFCPPQRNSAVPFLSNSTFPSGFIPLTDCFDIFERRDRLFEFSQYNLNWTNHWKKKCPPVIPLLREKAFFREMSVHELILQAYPR